MHIVVYLSEPGPATCRPRPKNDKNEPATSRTRRLRASLDAWFGPIPHKTRGIEHGDIPHPVILEPTNCVHRKGFLSCCLNLETRGCLVAVSSFFYLIGPRLVLEAALQAVQYDDVHPRNDDDEMGPDGTETEVTFRQTIVGLLGLRQS